MMLLKYIIQCEQGMQGSVCIAYDCNNYPLNNAKVCY